MIDFLNLEPKIFVIDGYAGFDQEYRKNIRIICSRPYHALFMKNMLLRDDESSLKKNFLSGPDFTVLNGGEFQADPHTEDVTSKTSINVNFSDHEMLILGT